MSTSDWERQELWPDEDLRLYNEHSPIAPGTPASLEIATLMKDVGLDVVGWQFTPVSKSAFARADADGKTAVYPYLQIAIRNDAGYEAQHIDAQSGNWDDDWRLTVPLRNGLNAIFERHGYGSDYVSERTFIFAFSWERRAYFRIGHKLKPRIREMTNSVLPVIGRIWHVEKDPSALYFGSYWGDEKGIRGQYNLYFASKTAMENALGFEEQLSSRATEMIRQADRWGFCQNHRAAFGFWHRGMKNLPPLYRED